eukprot:2307126-Pyramimonas_sp.AAC.1
MAFLKGLTYQELAETTGEKGTCGVLYHAAWIGNCAPRATRGFGLRPTSYDEEFETSSNLLTAKH